MEVKEIYIEQDYSAEMPNTKGASNGICYAQYLRRECKYAGPILFTSINTYAEVLKYKDATIINAIGHSFLIHPYSTEEYQKATSSIYALNEIQLSDIIINYCNAGSALTEGFHILKGALNATLNDTTLADEEKHIKVETLLNNFRLALIKNYSDNTALLEEYDSITSRYKKDDLKSIKNITGINDASLALKIPSNEKSVDKPIKKYRWKVLLLEDNPNEIGPLLEALKKNEIEYIWAPTVEKAKEIITEDESNNITVAISDYRLFEAQKNNLPPRMQREQGYDFLIWLSSQDRYTARVALSGLSTHFLMDSFRKYSVNVKVYSKNNIVNSGVDLLLNDIEYLGEYYEDINNSRPTAASWQHLKPYYIAYKKLPNADIVENYISEKSNEIIEEVKYQIERKVHGKGDKINSVKKEDKWKMCREFTLDSSVGETQSNFDNKSYEIINDENLQRFYCKLINRRVLIYFTLYPEIDISILSWLLSKGAIAVEGNLPDTKSQEENKKQVFTTHALKESDIPLNLLLEEKQWLGRMGINVKGYKVTLENFYNLFENFFTICAPLLAQKYSAHFRKDKSIKGIKNKMGSFLAAILATDRAASATLIKNLEIIVSKMEKFFPDSTDLEDLKLEISKYANRR